MYFMAKILIADIEPETNIAMKDILEKIGNIVYTANTKEEAIDAVKRYRPDVVSIDIRERPFWNMRLDVLKKIKELDRNIRIFVVTTFGLGMKEDEAKIKAMGVEDCIQKPIDLVKFVEKLKRG